MARAGHPAASRLAAEDTLRTDSRLRREEGRTGNRGCPAAAAAGRSPGEGIHLAAAAAAVGRTGGSGGLDWDSPGSLPTTAGTAQARGPAAGGTVRTARGDRARREVRERQGAAVLRWRE